MHKCLYCNQDAERDALMLLVCELEYTKVYVTRNQNFYGRCVVALKEHKEEMFQLTEAEQQGFMKELSLVSKAVYDLAEPDKLNYAIYGDGVPHLHCHIVPKKKGGFCWGQPFVMDGNNHILEQNEVEELAARFRGLLEQ